MSWLGWAYLLDFIFGWSDSPSASFNHASELAQKAVELDDQDPAAHGLLGITSLYQGKHEKAIFEGRRAISLNPNYALGYGHLGAIMSYCGQFDEAITMTKKAYRLNPNLDPVFLYNLSSSYIFLERYEKALEVCNEMEEHVLNGRLGEFKCFPPLYSSWVYQELGREEEARVYMAEALKRQPDLSLEWIKRLSPYKNPAHLQRMQEAFRKAGMPEKTPGAVQKKPSIAVLPFVNISGDQEQEYFSDGLSEELINKLAQVKDLQVTGRTSSFYFKNKDIDPRTIGEKLGVTYLLEGSVRKSGNQLRVTAQLIKAEDGYHLFSKTYDRELRDIFSIQDNIANAVTTALSVTLGVGEFNRPGMTRNIKAFDEYLRAMSNLYKYNPDSIIAAIDQFKQALDIDPDFGLGWIGLRRVYNIGIQILPPGQTVDFEARATEALKRARAIAPDMPALLMATAEEHTNNGNWLEADSIWKQILDEQGHANSVANRYYGLMLLRAGRNNDALPYLQRAKRLDPLSPLNSNYLVWILMNLGRLDEAQTEVERGKNLEGFDPMLIFFEWAIAFEAGDIMGAIGLIENSYNINNNDTSELLSEAFMLQLVELLKDENTDFALNRVRQMAADKSRSHWEKWLLAIWSGILDDPQLSFDIFKEVPGFYSIMPWARNLGSDIRQLPDFKEWLLEKGFVDYWRGTGKWPDLCHPVGDDDFECD